MEEINRITIEANTLIDAALSNFQNKTINPLDKNVMSMCGDGSQTKSVQNENSKLVNLEEKKKFICASVRKLEQKDLIDLSRCIYRLGVADKLKYGADGARINLDTLADFTDLVVNQLYAQIKYKLEKNSMKNNHEGES